MHIIYAIITQKHSMNGIGGKMFCLQEILVLMTKVFTDRPENGVLYGIVRDESLFYVSQ